MFWISRSNQFSTGLKTCCHAMTCLAAISFPYESGSYNYQQIINYFTEEPERRDRSLSNCHHDDQHDLAGVGISVIPPMVIQKELRQVSCRC